MKVQREITSAVTYRVMFGIYRVPFYQDTGISQSNKLTKFCYVDVMFLVPTTVPLSLIKHLLVFKALFPFPPPLNNGLREIFRIKWFV